MMLAFINCLRPAACIAIGVLTLALGQSANAEGCRGGGGATGQSHGGKMSGGQANTGHTSTHTDSTRQSSGTTGSCMRQSSGTMGSGTGQSYGTMGSGYTGYTSCTGQSYGTTGSNSGQSYGTMSGCYGQGSSSTGSQNATSLQQAVTSSTTASLNNPATVLAHAGDLNLTSQQMYALEKMLKSRKQHAALVLTSAQRKQLAGIVGIVRKSGTTGT